MTEKFFREALWDLYGAGDAEMREDNRVWSYRLGSKRLTVRSDYFDNMIGVPDMDRDISDEDDPSLDGDVGPSIYDRMEELRNDITFTIEYNGVEGRMTFRTPKYVVDYMHFTMRSFDGEEQDVNAFASIPGNVPQMPLKTNGKKRTLNFCSSHYFPRWMIYFGDLIEVDMPEEMSGILKSLLVTRNLSA